MVFDSIFLSMRNSTVPEAFAIGYNKRKKYMIAVVYYVLESSD